MRSPNLREKFLDEEKLFIKYWEMGESRSYSLLTEWAILEGMTSSTGNSPTQMGIWKAMWRWASKKENQQRAWTIFNQHTNKPWEHYEKEMLLNIKSAWQFNSDAKYQRFLRNNEWA